MMNYYFAPMEGITGYVYRSVWDGLYGNADKVFLPFVSPTQNGSFSPKDLRNMLTGLPSNGIAVPQLMVNCASNFIWAARELSEYGFKEINLNLGCPSATVVTKKKGAGFLSVPDSLDKCLEEIFTALPDINISVKTRLGMIDESEFACIAAIYNKYPICELTIHARVREDYYKKPVHLECYRDWFPRMLMPVCYNGDIFTASDTENFCLQNPGTESIMLGRGLLSDPGLIRHIKSGRRTAKEELYIFCNSLFEEYSKVLYGEKNVLQKMKELWFYMSRQFQEPEKYINKINHSANALEYKTAVDRLFSDKDIFKEPRITFI